MGHNLEGRKVKVMVRDSCSVGYMARKTSTGISHCIGVVGLKDIVHRKHKQFQMLDKAFLGSMQHWIIGRNFTRNILSRWTVSLVINLPLF